MQATNATDTSDFCPAPVFSQPEIISQAPEQNHQSLVSTKASGLTTSQKIEKIQQIVLTKQTEYENAVGTDLAVVKAEQLKSALTRGRERLQKLKSTAPSYIEQINELAASWRNMIESLDSMKAKKEFASFIHKEPSLSTRVYDWIQRAPTTAFRTILSSLYPDITTNNWGTRLLPTKEQIIQTLWSRDPAFLGTIQKYADEKLGTYNKISPHQVTRCTLPMADTLRLHGVRFTHPEYTNEMILFGGLRQYCEYFVERAWTYHQHFKSNVLIFDFRGTHAEHRSAPTESEIIQDSVRLVKTLMDEQKVPQEKITLYGTSLGGAFALMTAAALADEGIVVTVVNERSFRNLPSVLASYCPGVGRLAARIPQQHGWLFDAEEAAKKLKGKLIVLHHPNDWYIFKKASLKQALIEKPLSNLTPIVIEMKDDGVCHSDFERYFESLPCYLGHLPLYFARGHNRPLNPGELQQLHKHLSQE